MPWWKVSLLMLGVLVGLLGLEVLWILIFGLEL